VREGGVAARAGGGASLRPRAAASVRPAIDLLMASC
jgi:hypothetical protein